jgi:hypothetical protein
MLPPIAVEIIEPYIEAYCDAYNDLNVYLSRNLLQELAEEAIQKIMDTVYVPDDEVKILAEKVHVYFCNKSNILLRHKY